MKIFKYPLPQITPGIFSINMPRGAKILTAQMQREVITLWANVEPDQPEIVREFAIVLTGQTIPPYMNYHGTFLLDEGSYVIHLFELL
jgi:hypothetical protein